MTNYFVPEYIENTENALLLMLTGMSGIFAVMFILIAAITILNKVTKDKDNEDK